jgi:rRNA maturation endonuclease Nob1
MGICHFCGAEYEDDFCEACGSSEQAMKHAYAVEQADNHRDMQREEEMIRGSKSTS